MLSTNNQSIYQSINQSIILFTLALSANVVLTIIQDICYKHNTYLTIKTETKINTITVRTAVTDTAITNISVKNKRCIYIPEYS